jgi:hypothetical protein
VVSGSGGVRAVDPADLDALFDGLVAATLRVGLGDADLPDVAPQVPAVTIPVLAPQLVCHRPTVQPDDLGVLVHTRIVDGVQRRPRRPDVFLGVTRAGRGSLGEVCSLGEGLGEGWCSDGEQSGGVLCR